jgi:hypothetical protein
MQKYIVLVLIFFGGCVATTHIKYLYSPTCDGNLVEETCPNSDCDTAMESFNKWIPPTNAVQGGVYMVDYNQTGG